MGEAMWAGIVFTMLMFLQTPKTEIDYIEIVKDLRGGTGKTWRAGGDSLGTHVRLIIKTEVVEKGVGVWAVPYGENVLRIENLKVIIDNLDEKSIAFEKFFPVQQGTHNNFDTTIFLGERESTFRLRYEKRAYVFSWVNSSISVMRTTVGKPLQAPKRPASKYKNYKVD